MKVLISTLGKGQFNKELKKYDYQKSIYLLPDGSEVETKLVSAALKEYLTPEKIYIIGTSESLWDLADKLIGNYEKVEIPFGRNEKEFWEIFKIVLEKLDIENKDVYVDITHGFRTIPLLVSTIMNIFTKVKNANVKGLYYGIFEAKDEKGRTPIVDLLPVLELNEWLDGFTLFKNYGDGNKIAQLISDKIKSFPLEEKKRLGNLNKLPKLLRKYSEAVGFTAIDFISDFSNQVETVLKSLNDFPEEFYPLELLKKSFIEISKEFTDEKEEWEKQFKITRWLYSKNRFSQSAIALRECILTYVLEKLGLDIKDEKLRERVSRLIEEDKKDAKMFTQEFISFFSKLREFRNNTGHAFMKKNISEGHIKNSIETLGSLIKETEEILVRNICIKDSTLLKERLFSEENTKNQLSEEL